jgi:hypothetical protein
LDKIIDGGIDEEDIPKVKKAVGDV